jgi:hypothetical protein
MMVAGMRIDNSERLVNRNAVFSTSNDDGVTSERRIPFWHSKQREATTTHSRSELGIYLSSSKSKKSATQRLGGHAERSWNGGTYLTRCSDRFVPCTERLPANVAMREAGKRMCPQVRVEGELSTHVDSIN